nr:reverse transcriptase domain-containing protein [Tanacetum cinerariifolium]
MAERLALANLDASITLMPLSMWNKLSLPELNPTLMTLELADRLISRPIGVTKDVYVKVGKFYFQADIFVVDFDADPQVHLILERSFLKTERALIDVFEGELTLHPRVPLILGRCFLKTSRALIDVHKGELTLHIGNEAITYNLDQTVRHSANYNQMTANKIDVIKSACEEYSQKVLSFSNSATSGTPIPHNDPIISATSPTLTLFGDSDFLLFEEADAFLVLEDDPDSLKINLFYYDPEGFTDALILMPKFASTLKALIGNKEKLNEMARTTMNEHCLTVTFNKFPRKLGDPCKFLIPCEFPEMDECLALVDLGQIEKFYEIFKEMSFEISFTNALILMPKFASTLKALIGNKEKLSEMARTTMNEHCSAVILNKLPRKLGDSGKFLIPCEFSGMDECLALADLGASINLMPLSVWEGLSLPELTPTCMTLELVDRLVSKPIGIAKDVSFKVRVFHFPADFVVVDFEPDPRVPLILKRCFLKTSRALINVHKGELTLRIRNEAITYNLDQTVRDSANYNQMMANKIDVIESACEEYYQEVLGFSNVTTSGTPTPQNDPIVFATSPTLTPFKDSDFLLFEEADAFLEQNLPSFKEELKAYEAQTVKSSVDEPPDVELKDLPHHLEYAFLEGDNKLPVIIAKELGSEEKAALIKVLKFHKRAIAWKLSDIQGINPEFCTHKILMKEDYKPAVQHQRRVNPKIYDVIKKEVKKLLDAGLIYPISNSPWVSPVHCVPKKGGFNVVENKENELIPTRLVTGWRMLERLAGNEYYCFLDGFSGYFQIPVDPRDQEKTTFTCLYGTFAYRRMPFGLCNAPGTFQRCMLAIFHDIVEKTMEVFMDDFSVFGNSFENCLSRFDKMLQRCEDTNLSLNWEKSHFMVKEGIVLGHKISKNGIEVDRAKVDVIAKLPHPTTVKGIRSFLGHAGFYRRFIQDFSKISRPMNHLLEKNTLFVFSEDCIQAF